MPRRPLQVLDAPTVGALLSPAARARTTGRLTWRVDKVIAEGIVPVTTDLQHVGAAYLRVMLRPVVAPSQPRMQYRVGDQSLRRLCVNEEHRPFSGTHKHKLTPFGTDEDTYEPTDIPVVPLAPRVAPGVVQAVFEAFAAECNVQLVDPYRWAEPPGR